MVFRPPEPDRFYVIGADVGQGSGGDGDASTACVLDVLSMEQVAEYASNTLDTYEFAHKLHDIVDFYAQGNRRRHPFLVVEANPIGQGVINVLRHDLGAWNLYRRQAFDRIEQKPTDKLGFLTGERTRDLLIADAQVVLRERPHTIRSPRLYAQLMSFMWMKKDKSGSKLKAEHAEGEKDDLVFAWMLAIHGQRLAYYSAAKQLKALERANVVEQPTSRAWRYVDRRRRLEKLAKRTGFPYASEADAWKLSSWPA